MQKLYKFAFCGKMGSGKTTATNMVAAVLQNKYGEDNTTAFLLKFANPIYRTVSLLHVPGKPRTFMQRFGDLCRNEFGDDIFEKVLEFEYNILLEQEIPKRTQNHILIMIDDVRFIGEAKLLKDLGFEVVKIEATDFVRESRLGETFKNISHRSETELDLIEPDLIVNNDKTYLDLHEQIKENLLGPYIGKNYEIS